MQLIEKIYDKMKEINMQQNFQDIRTITREPHRKKSLYIKLVTEKTKAGRKPNINRSRFHKKSLNKEKTSHNNEKEKIKSHQSYRHI